MSFTKLVASQIKPLLARLNDELGKADQQRIQALLDIHTESTLNYATVISTLFPDQPQEKAQNSFRSFRNRFNNAAEEIGVLLKFEVDSNKRSEAAERECWFEGEDSKVAQIAQYSKEEASDQNSEKLVPAKGRVIGGGSKETLSEKPLIKLFISYARKDNRDTKKVDLFFDELDECFKASKHFHYERWADWDILIGEEWHDGIMGALDECDFGLMMVSLPFINSEYIEEHELPKLLKTGRALPVAFKKFDIKKFDLKGLQPHQIFRHNDKFYDQFTGTRKSDFIQGLFHSIEKRIQKTHEEQVAIAEESKKNSPAGPEPLLDTEPVYCPENTIAEIVKTQADKDFDPNFTEGRGRPVGIKTVVDLVAKKKMEADENAIIATDYLMDWASKEGSRPFCAVLGEYGMGKTTTLKAFTRQLLEQRLENSNLPLPIYIDLREYTWDKKVDFDLNDILAHILKKSWKGGHAKSLVSPQDIISYVQENRALMIWDGLDEVIVHMEPKYANDFIRQLWRILPPLKQDKEQNPNAGKMLISCRSHYFRDVNQQNSMLTSEHRDGIKGEDYEALILLPFGQQQIETYLQKSLGISGAGLRKTIDLISSVHNLPEMAERPYTLSLIAQHIPQIEELSLHGEVIQGVTLYKSMVENWLARDTGKHQFSPQHKKQLMEYLSAALWRTGQRQWTVDDLDEWLDDFLYGNPRIADAYRKMDREVLKEDLRTATFITRSDDEHFRFAHTSLQEFFLASYLHRGLYAQQRENWRLFSEENSALPSNETLDFMVQLYTSEPRHQAKCKRSMVLWLAEYEQQSSKLLFKVWLMLTGSNEIIPYEQLSLPEVDLSHWQFKGTAQRHLIIHDADFSNAKLDHIVFDYVQFQNCNFTQSNLWLSELQHCQFEHCQFDQSNLTASLWRHNDLTSLNLEQAKVTDSQWINNKNQTVLWSDPSDRPERFVERSLLINKVLSAQINTGHCSIVHSIAFSPCGNYIVSGADDNTVKLWEISSACCVHSFEGHTGSVSSVSFCPMGKHVASGANDKTIKLWEIASGHCIHSFEGHSSTVKSVVFSLDGKRIGSGANDNTVKLWDINDGHCIHTFQGHMKPINSVAFSPDSKYIASGANDETIKLWDVSNKDCINTFEGHSDPISTIAFSPDSKRLASASNHNVVKLWDISSGLCINTFEEDSILGTSIAFSPDGKYIASATHGRTIKLFDIINGCCINTFVGHSKLMAFIAFSPNGMHIASASYDNNIKLWDIGSGHCINDFTGHSNYITSVAFSPNDNLIVSGDNGKTIKLWDASSGKLISTFEGHSEIIRSIAFSPDGIHIASGALDDTIKLWDIKSGRCINTFEGHTNFTSSVTFSPKGNQIAAGGSQNTIKLWDISSRKLISTFKGHFNEVSSVVFCPSGKYIASGSIDNTIKLWEVSNELCINTFKGHSAPVETVAFSPHGKHIASGSSDNSIKLWEISSGHCINTFEGHAQLLSSIAFSPDGKQIVSGAHDNNIKLWDISSGRCINDLTEHSGGIRAVAFSHDGECIVSSANDNTIKIWKADNGKLLNSIHQLPRDSTATIDERTNKIIYGSKEAWRYLYYKEPTENILEATLYPAEIYGPLPGSDE